MASVFNQMNENVGEAVRNGNRAQAPALRKQAMDEIRKSLTDEQKKKLEALTGKSFAFSGPGGAPGAAWPSIISLPGSDAARLVLNASVQKELKLTEDQTKSIQQGLDKVQKQFGDKVGTVSKVGPGEKIDPESVSDIAKKVEPELRKSIGAVLEPGQLKRFHQIELQARGIGALQNKDVIKALNLTDDQKRRVKALAEELTSDTRKLFGSAIVRDRAKLREIAQAQRKLFREAAGRIPSLLTADQRKIWEEMIGTPFDFEADHAP